MKVLELLNALTRYKLGDKHVPIDEVHEAISELEEIQQHTKSLEAQLNTEQLTYETNILDCKTWVKIPSSQIRIKPKDTK